MSELKKQRQKSESNENLDVARKASEVREPQKTGGTPKDAQPNASTEAAGRLREGKKPSGTAEVSPAERKPRAAEASPRKDGRADGAIVKTERLKDGALKIESIVGPPDKRGGYERQMFRGVEVGLKGWDRSHSQGAGTGAESAEGIRYAPKEVNQAWQNKGIEAYIRDLHAAAEKRGVTLHLITETRTHPGTLRLASIAYRIDGVKNGERHRLLEAEITIEDKREKPRVTASASKFGFE